MTGPQITAGRYTCPVCAVRLETVGEKKRHMKKRHTPKESDR